MKTAVLMLLLLAAVVSVSARGYGSGGGGHGGGHGGGYGGGGGGKKSKFNIGALFAKKKKLIGGIKQKIGGIFAAVKAPILRIKGKLLKKGGQILTKKGRFFTNLASSLKNKFNKGGGGGYGGGHGGGHGGGGRPSSGYGAPSRPSSGYGAPSSGYGAPSRPSSGYGAPSSGGHGGGSGHSSGGHSSGGHGGGSGHSSGGHGGRGGSGGAVSSYSSYGTAKTFSLERDQHEEVSPPTTTTYDDVTTTTHGDVMSPSPIWTSGGFRPMHPETVSLTYTTSGSDNRHRQTGDESYTVGEAGRQNYRSGQSDHQTNSYVQTSDQNKSNAPTNDQSQTYSAPKASISQSYSAPDQRHTTRENNGAAYQTSQPQGTTRKPYNSPGVAHNADHNTPAPSYQASGNHQISSRPSYQASGNHQNTAKPSYTASNNHQNAVKSSYQAPDNHQNTAKPSYQSSGNHQNNAHSSYQTSSNHQNTAKPSYQNYDNHQNNANPSYQNSANHATRVVTVTPVPAQTYSGQLKSPQSGTAGASFPVTTYNTVGHGQLKSNSNAGRLESYNPGSQRPAVVVTATPSVGANLATAHNQQSYGSQSSGSSYRSPRPNVFPGVTTGGSSVRFQGPSYTGSSVKTVSTSSVRPVQSYNAVQSSPQPGQTYSPVQSSPPQPGQIYTGLGGTNRSPSKTSGTLTANQPQATPPSSSYSGVASSNSPGTSVSKTAGLRTTVSYGGVSSQRGLVTSQRDRVTSQRQSNPSVGGSYSGDAGLSSVSPLSSNIGQSNSQRATVGSPIQSTSPAYGGGLKSAHPEKGTGFQSTHSNVLPATRFNTFSGTSGSSTGEHTLTPYSNSVSESYRPTLADQLGPDFDVDTIRKSIEANIARVTRSGAVFDPPLALAQRREDDALETAAFLVDGVTITPAGLLTLELLRAQKSSPEAPVSSPGGASVRPKRALTSAAVGEGMAVEADSQSEDDVVLEVLTSGDNSQWDAVELLLRSSLSSSGDNHSRRRSAFKSQRLSSRE